MPLLDRSLFQLHRHFKSNSDDPAFLINQTALTANQMHFCHADSSTCLSSLLPISSLARIPRPSLKPLVNNSHTNTHQSGQPGGMNDERERERE